MKKIHYIALLLVGLLASCNTNDDGFYLNKFIDTTNMIVIGPHSSTYTVNEKLYVKASIPRLVAEPGQSTLIDVKETTGADAFAFSYLIEKQNGDNWEVVYADNNQIDLVKGGLLNGPYLYSNCQYYDSSDSYEYEAGFPLVSAGTYRLSFGYNGEATDRVNIRSESIQGNIIMNLNSTVAGLDSEGYYNFTVTN
jgi:hypothetical protein